MNKKIETGVFNFILYKCVFPFTGLFTLLTVISSFLIASNNKTVTVAWLREKLFVVFVISLGVALCNLIFYFKKISLYFRIATHFILTELLLILVIWLSDYIERGQGWVIIPIAYALLYVIVCSVVLLVYYSKKKKKSEKPASEYKPLYK